MTDNLCNQLHEHQTQNMDETCDCNVGVEFYHHRTMALSCTCKCGITDQGVQLNTLHVRSTRDSLGETTSVAKGRYCFALPENYAEHISEAMGETLQASSNKPPSDIACQPKVL